MDQNKVGSFIKELRKVKNLTQEKMAEKFNVSRRTVSRWETGNNMPDLDILIEMSDFFEVDLREILDGERKSENMNDNVKETLTKAVEYTNTEKEIKKKKLNRYFLTGGLCILAVVLDRQFDFLSYIFVKNASEFVRGALCGLGLVFEFVGFYNNNHEVSLKQRKMSLIKQGKS